MVEGPQGLPTEDTQQILQHIAPYKGGLGQGSKLYRRQRLQHIAPCKGGLGQGSKLYRRQSGSQLRHAKTRASPERHSGDKGARGRQCQQYAQDRQDCGSPHSEGLSSSSVAGSHLPQQQAWRRLLVAPPAFDAMFSKGHAQVTSKLLEACVL